MKRKALVIMVLVLLGAVVVAWPVYKRLSAGQKGNEQERRRSAAVAVEVTPVLTTTVRDIGVFTGTLLPRSEFLVAAKVPGRLEKLYVDIGDLVKRGDTVAILDSEELAQQAEEARATLAVAKATEDNCKIDLDVAKIELERVLALLAKKIASPSEKDAAQAQYDSCEAKLKVTKATVEQKTAAHEAAKIRLSYAEVKAWWEEPPANKKPAAESKPADKEKDEPTRVVGERFVHEGELLKANDPIVSVLDDRVLIAVINVIERDYPKIKVEQVAALSTEAYPDRAFTGKVVRIAPLLKETSRQARVEIQVPNEKGPLKSGMFITASIEFARHEGAALVPRSALVRREGRQGIFLADLDQRKARFVPVTVGIVEGELAEIVRPEKLSGHVVTLGQHLLVDGAGIVISAVGGRSASRPSSQEAQP